MSAAGRLDGLRVLLVEDDYYLATDEKLALEQAGARVIGPFRDAGEVVDLVAQQRVDCAVVDIHLGQGPNFALARTLQQQGLPFVFVTGYDQAVIPPDLAAVERLEKPIREGDLIAAVERACR